MVETGRLERRVGLMLRAGVVLAALVIVCGLALLALRGDPALAQGDAAAFARPPAAGAFAPRGVCAGALRGEAAPVILLGLFILMALPVVRVASTVLFFALEGEVALAVIAGAVLLLLLL